MLIKPGISVLRCGRIVGHRRTGSRPCTTCSCGLQILVCSLPAGELKTSAVRGGSSREDSHAPGRGTHAMMTLRDPESRHFLRGSTASDVPLAMSFLAFLAQTLRRRRRRPRASVEVDERLAVRVAGGGSCLPGSEEGVRWSDSSTVKHQRSEHNFLREFRDFFALCCQTCSVRRGGQAACCPSCTRRSRSSLTQTRRENRPVRGYCGSLI